MKKIFIKKLFFCFFFLTFFLLPKTAKAQGKLVEAYYGEFTDYQGVPQGKAMTTEELKLITDQDEKTSFSTNPAAQAAMLFRFNVGSIDSSQDKLTFSWTGFVSTSDSLQILFFDQSTKTWADKDLLTKSLSPGKLTTFAIAFDQNGNTGDNKTIFGLSNLANASGDVWLAVLVKSENSTLTTNEVNLQVTTPTSIEPQTTITLNGLTGKNGWFRSAVTVEFKSVPARGNISKIEYSLNNEPLQTYTGPFTVSAENISQITYRARDDAYTEGLKWNEIKIDTCLPIVYTPSITLYDRFSQNQGSVWEGLFGLDGQTLHYALLITLQDPNYWQSPTKYCDGGEETTFFYNLDNNPTQQAINNLIRIEEPGRHNLQIWAGEDRAGNPGSISYTVNFFLDFSQYEETIDPSGGTINTYYGDTLTIPEGALTTKTNITTQIIESSEISQPTPIKATVLPHAYQFGPEGTTFSTPITVVFKYTDEDLGGGNPNKLGVYVWDSTSDQWVFKQGKVDTVNKTLTVELDHFSLFILAIDSTPPEITISPLAQNYLLGTTLSISASDNLSGLTGLEASLDGIPVANLNQITLSQVGQHTLSVFAEDQMGNKTNASFSFNVFKLSWLPPLSTQEIYALQNGSTLPIKFSVLDLEGKLIAESSVKIEILNSNQELVAGPFIPGINPVVGIDLQNHQYHFNLKTKDENLKSGIYTLKASFFSPSLFGSASTSFELLEGGKAKGKN